MLFGSCHKIIWQCAKIHQHYKIRFWVLVFNFLDIFSIEIIFWCLLAVFYSKGEADSWSREWDRHHQSTSVSPLSCMDYFPWFIYFLGYLYLYLFLYLLTSIWLHFICFFKAGENEADDPLQIDNVFTPPVLWCYTLYPNEWEETDLGLSSLWQEGAIWTPHYWWVSKRLFGIKLFCNIAIDQIFYSSHTHNSLSNNRK